MELRSCNQSQLHFIQAIKGGQVIKVLNVTRGRPKLSLKKVSEIYGIVGSKSQAASSTLKLKDDEPQSFVFGNGPAQVERTCLPLMEAGRIVEKTNHEVSSSASDDNENEGSNDLGITLKQIQDKCKTKKRKLAKGINSTTQTTFTQSDVKEEIKTFDEEINLLEPLSSWRSKLLTDKKLKKKFIKCKVDISSEGVASTVKSEESSTCQGFVLFTGSSTAILGIKSEPSEPEFPDVLQVHERTCSSSGDDMPDTSCNSMSSEFSGTINECTRESDVINEITIKTPYYAGDYVSHEFSEVRPLQMRDLGWDIMLGDSKHPDESLLDLPVLAIPNQGGVNHLSYTCALDDGILISEAESQSGMVNETCNECHDMIPIQQSLHLHTLALENGGHATHPAYGNTLESENLLSSTNEHRACVINKECFDQLEQFNLNPVQNVGAKIDDEYDLQQSGSHSSDIFSVKFAEEQGNAHTFSHDLIDTEISTEDKVSANVNSPKNKLQRLAEEENEFLSFKVNGIQGLNVNNGEHPLGYDRASENASPCTDTRSMICNYVGDCFPSWNGDIILHKEDLPETEKERSSNPEYADEKGYPYAFTDLSADGDENNSCYKLHHPERLLSARKTISLSSQKKLCEALQSIDLQETERFKCREKLNFANHTEDQNRTAEGAYKIRRARFTYNRKKPVGKLNTYKGGHLSENVKGPHVYRASHVNTRCTSTQSCSENAIAFSLRQMHDIEYLATKLTKELTSMKDTVEDILESESYATSMKHKMDKVRIAVKNAKRAEEASKRLLSMMTRDCSRFCKIMRLTENGSPSSQNVTSKVKKISFADEAGGELCNIKLF